MLTNKIIHKLQIRLLREYGLKFTADAIGFLSIVAEQVNQRHGQHSGVFTYAVSSSETT